MRFLMIGRPKKKYSEIWRPIYIETEIEAIELLKNIPVLCPDCQSAEIGTFGTHKRQNGRVEYFQCKNPECSHLKIHKIARQFTLSTSWCFMTSLNSMLGRMTKEIMQGKVSQSAIAEKYEVSDSLIAFIRTKIEKTLDFLYGLDHLVFVPTADTAVAGDETFIRINGVPFYIIMFTGHTTHKILGISVSKTRSEADIRQVFDEANQNTKNPIRVITADAWGATQTMAKNLNRPITLVIHRHKRPYDKAIIWEIEYKDNLRKITKIGVKCDFFEHRGKREYHYMVEEEDLTPPIPKKQGRPKGVKNGQGKKRKKMKSKKKRGRKGIFAPFDRGKRGYAKIDPFRKTLRLAKDVSPAVAAAFGETKDLFWHKSISNNLAENINSVVEARVHLTGPKSPERLEQRLRAFLLIRNNSEILDFLPVSHRFQTQILFNEWKHTGMRLLIEISKKYANNEKMGVLVN